MLHMGREHASREKKLPMVNFLIFVQKNVSTIRFQEIKIRPLGGFEKMRFLDFVQDCEGHDVSLFWMAFWSRVDCFPQTTFFEIRNKESKNLPSFVQLPSP